MLCMLYKNKSSPRGQKSTCMSLEDCPRDEIDRCEIYVWEAVLCAPDKSNIT